MIFYLYGVYGDPEEIWKKTIFDHLNFIMENILKSMQCIVHCIEREDATMRYQCHDGAPKLK